MIALGFAALGAALVLLALAVLAWRTPCTVADHLDRWTDL